MPYLMVKSQLIVRPQLKQQVVHQTQQIAKKACFGTKEWSENSGICNRCNYKAECGKILKNRSG
jgi:hypothetical protein